jgi:Aminoglycoside-2''-adenylyltransferase
MPAASEHQQLAAIRRLHVLFERSQTEYWLFGGWAVDFHAGRVTRAHADIDIAVWRADLATVHSLLLDEGWTNAPAPDEDGYTAYQRGELHLDLAFLARDEDGTIYTPLREGRGSWPPDSFPGAVVKHGDVCAHVVSLESLIVDKSEARDDPSVSTKDRADVAVLTHLHR